MSSQHGKRQLYVRRFTSEDDRLQVHFALYKENLTLREFQMKIHKNSVGEIKDSVYAQSILVTLRTTRIKI
jgi:3-deoxy-D-manno-octulosonic-acid transferase